MKYHSTRGKVRDRSFEDALFMGFASDGGIMLPERLPSVSKETLKSWKSLSYGELAKVIVPMFVTEEELPTKDLHALLDKAFQTFSCPEVAPVRRLKDGLTILELFHGRTWAFKDLALSVVGQLYNYFCSRRREHFIVVVGTSGDTGSAAISAVRGLPWVDVVVLLPAGRCSRVQELQMTTVIEDNVHVYRVEGSSDDLDIPIKACFMDTEFVKEHKLVSINSINWARIMVQTVHYFYSYLQMCPSCDGEVEVIVPTGACGNVTAGCVARKMGLPVTFVCAVNQNDIVSRSLDRGDHSMATDVIPTLSTAMDIQIPYNIERLWYLFSDGDHELVLRHMLEFEKTGRTEVPSELQAKIREVIRGTFVASDDVILSTMRRVWQENNGYMVCPHTATAAAYHYTAGDGQNGATTKPRICIATASVAKFEEAVQKAGLTMEKPASVQQLEQLPTRFSEMRQGEDWEKILRVKIVEISSRVNP